MLWGERRQESRMGKQGKEMTPGQKERKQRSWNTAERRDAAAKTDYLVNWNGVWRIRFACVRASSRHSANAVFPHSEIHLRHLSLVTVVTVDFPMPVRSWAGVWVWIMTHPAHFTVAILTLLQCGEHPCKGVSSLSELPLPRLISAPSSLTELRLVNWSK